MAREIPRWPTAWYPAAVGQNACPTCGEPIPTANINVAEGVALCTSCGKLAKLSDIVEGSVRRPVDEILAKTPRGCSVRDHGDSTLIRCSARSIGAAVAAGFFALFWNGIVSVFVLIAAAALYTNLVGPVPEWFPAPEFDAMPLGMAIFLCIFLVPFILVGLFMIGVALLSLFGSVDVRLRGGKGVISTGVGPLRWCRRFDAAQVKAITIGKTAWQQNGHHKPVIRIEADRNVKFGSMLTEMRREWLRAVLTVLLVSGDAHQRDRIGRQTFKPRDYRRA